MVDDYDHENSKAKQLVGSSQPICFFFCSPSSAIGPFSVEGFPSKKQQQQQQPNIAGYWKTLPHLLLFQIGQMWLMEFWAQTW